MTSEEIEFMYRHVVGKKPTCYWNVQEKLHEIPMVIQKILTGQSTPNHMQLRNMIYALTKLQHSYACIFQENTNYFIIYKDKQQYHTLQSKELTKETKKVEIHYYILNTKC